MVFTKTISINDLERGDPIGIDWADVYENPTGDPNSAVLAKRHSIGYFWGKGEDRGIPVIITTTTIDEIDGSQGYCIYPVVLILQIREIKRKRRKRMKEEKLNGVETI